MEQTQAERYKPKSEPLYSEKEPFQLNISQLIDFAAKFYPDQEIVTRTLEGPMHRYTFEQCSVQSKKVAQALTGLDIQISDRVGTVAMNTYRHFECYYGIQGMGAVITTLNPRLHPEQFTYVTNHAEVKILCVDLMFLPIIEKLFHTFKTVEKVILLTSSEHMPTNSSIQEYLVCYDELLKKYDGKYEWPQLDERLAACLSYTSGTTGNPKGAIYSHRSTILQCMRLVCSFALPIDQTETVLSIVPMFHTNAWGLIYCCFMSGYKLILPGAKMDGESIYELIEQENVILTAGVPTVSNMLLKYCEDNKKIMKSLKKMIIGGAAVPLTVIQKYHDVHDVQVLQGWGMTELPPPGVITKFTTDEEKLSLEEKQLLVRKAGKAVFGCDMRIVDDNGNILPHDGKQSGNLHIRGFGLIGYYYKDDRKDSFLENRWFNTGDVCSIDRQGWMTITDRSKDVIKSGGEWISSIDLENAAMGHPNVYEAAVIGLPHPKFDERPLMVIVKNKKDEEITLDEMKKYLSDKVAKWWLPNDLAFVDELPKQATGKVSKLTLREQFKNHVFSN